MQLHVPPAPQRCRPGASVPRPRSPRPRARDDTRRRPSARRAARARRGVARWAGAERAAVDAAAEIKSAVESLPDFRGTKPAGGPSWLSELEGRIRGLAMPFGLRAFLAQLPLPGTDMGGKLDGYRQNLCKLLEEAE